MGEIENPEAFPCVAFGPMGDGHLQSGMTLRDWFAGQALAGYIAHLGSQEIHASEFTDECAREAYLFADAMLAHRQQERAE